MPLGQKKADLNIIFDWFEQNFTEKFRLCFCDFWEDSFELKFFSLTDSDTPKNDALAQGDLFFVHKVVTKMQDEIAFRFSSDFVRNFLHTYLGSNNGEFNLRNLSALEVKIFSSFSEFLYKRTEASYTVNNAEHNMKNNSNYNLTFLIGKEGFENSKLTVTIPKKMLAPKPYTVQNTLNLDSFEKVATDVDFVFGATKMTLSELKNLCKNDIVLLEESSVKEAKIRTKDSLQPFAVKPKPSLIIDLEEQEHNDTTGGNMSKNVWDDIQVEVTAEFKKIKMTLGSLKQISKGLVIDLDSVFDNKIFLVVEDKVVAKGELVIINDKYGVKLEEIISSEDTAPKPVEPAPLKPNPAAAKPQPPQGAVKKPLPPPSPKANTDEDFDYSDFENDEK